MKRLPDCDILSQHATLSEREDYARCIVENQMGSAGLIIKNILDRIKPARKPSTKRIDAATGKLIVRYGKQQVIDSIGRWVPPEDRPTVSAGDAAQAG